jgi:glycosyltransferase involved in cell wall biosynthesis
MKVSIIIPAHNAEAFIGRALQSAMGAGTQVRGGYEIIVVDDGSTDGTSDVVGRFVAGGAPILLLSQPKSGAPAARNAGVAASSGEWLQFLDADDTFDGDKIARQIRLGQDAAWVVGAYRHLFADGSTEDTLPADDLWKGLFYGFRTGHTISNLLRRDAFQRVGGWDETLTSSQDPDLHFRLLRAGVPAVRDEVVGSYYHHHAGPGRITHSDAAERYRTRTELLTRATTFLERNRPEYWHANAPYFLGGLVRVIRQWATYDVESAAAFYQNRLADRPDYSSRFPLPHLPRYTRLYPLLGFERTERLRLSLSTVLPPSLKRLLKA